MFSSVHQSEVVKHLIIINAIMMVATFLAQSVFRLPLTAYLGLYYIDFDAFQPWQIVTHMFMHGGLAHIFFNMYALFIFGVILERVWGAQRFLFYYLFTGLMAAVFQLGATAVEYQLMYGTIFPISQGISEPAIPMVGASGAVMGVVAAFGVLFPNTQLQLLFPPVRLTAKWLVVIVIGIDVLMLFMGNTGIAHWAHIGGALSGFLLIKLVWGRDRNTFY